MKYNIIGFGYIDHHSICARHEVPSARSVAEKMSFTYSSREKGEDRNYCPEVPPKEFVS
jgi:hypothetical protein